MAVLANAMRLPRDNRPSDTPRPGVGGGVRLPVRRSASAQAIRTGSAWVASPCSSTGSRDFGSKGAMT